MKTLAILIGCVIASDAQPAISVYPASINNQGAITGTLWDGSRTHGFVRDPKGNMTVFDYDAGTGAWPYGTWPSGINNQGTITGVVGIQSSNGVEAQGFARDAAGTITVFKVGSNTSPTAISDSGVITGSFVSQTGANGFVHDPRGNMTTFNPPGSVYTVPTCINASGTIAGVSTDGAFVRDSSGEITIFDPGSPYDPKSINAQGTITGTFTDGTGHIHGFVRSPKGEIIVFDVAESLATFPTSINAAGTITGTWSRGGFVRDQKGEITVFDMSGWGATHASGINAPGTITGSVDFQNRPSRGFVRNRNGDFTLF